MKKISLRILIFLFLCQFVFSFEISLTENGQRIDGSKLWDIGYQITELEEFDSIRITVSAITTTDETLRCETFIPPSDTGFISSNGFYHIVWNIGIDEPNREFYDRRIVILLNAALPGVEPGVCNDILKLCGGNEHSILLRNDGTVWTWGDNEQGELGDMTLENRLMPVQVWGISGIGMLSGIRDIAAGYEQNLSVILSGGVQAWGRNHRGQLGTGVAGGDGGPIYDPGIDSYVPLAVRNPSDDGTLSGALSVGAGKNHSLCVMTDGSMYSWGYNLSGQLGNGNFGGSGDEYSGGIDSDLPVRIRGTDGAGFVNNAIATAAGSYHSLALLEDGTVRSWGSNYYGQLGLGTLGGDPSDFDVGIDQNYPQIVIRDTGTPLDNIVYISAGGYHSIAIDDEGHAWTWGRNNRGQLGINTTTNSPYPIMIEGGETGEVFLSDIIAVVGGGYHTLALRNDGTLWSFGENFYGQLGNGGTGGSPSSYDPGIDRLRAVQVWGPSGTGFFGDVELIGAGWYHSLANTSDGTVWAWGNNEDGQLGDDTTVDRNFPTEVAIPW